LGDLVTSEYDPVWPVASSVRLPAMLAVWTCASAFAPPAAR